MPHSAALVPHQVQRRVLRALGFLVAALPLCWLPAQASAGGAAPDHVRFRSLHSFNWLTGKQTTGAQPFAGLMVASDGQLYGSSVYAGPRGSGTVFRSSPRGEVAASPMYDGGPMDATLTEGPDGNLYGTSRWTIFRLSEQGRKYRVLHEFTESGAEGYFSQSRPLILEDGSLLGTTSYGGADGKGTVFRLTPDGQVHIVHSFVDADGCDTGKWPGPVLARDGALYGTCGFAGVVYRLTLDGVFTRLHTFESAEGRNPTGLLQASDGNFYGSNYIGGPYGGGTVFRMTPAGEVTVLHAFNPTTEGSGVYTPMQARDGLLYGVTSSSANTSRGGTIFQLSLAGEFKRLHVFQGADGAFPTGALVEGQDGRLYGTTYLGGAADAGTLFTLARKGAPTGLVNRAAPATR